jgi:hypothetical protein
MHVLLLHMHLNFNTVQSQKRNNIMVTFAQAVASTETHALTTNGMDTLANSLDPLVDLFFTIGSSRGKDITAVFERAFQHDRTTAAKILFWARDVRGGAGERSTFRSLLLHMERLHPGAVLVLLPHIPEYGRWDDMLIFETDLVQQVAYNLYAAALMQKNGLAAKWAPRKHAVANRLRKYMNMTPKAYRKLVVELSRTVETQMCAQQWTEINYSHVPSVAAARYQSAFARHDTEGYGTYRAALTSGDASVKINSSAVYPYDVVKSLAHGDAVVAQAQWDSLPNYLGEDFILPMVDVSGSMITPVSANSKVNCIDVAVSLGLYLADKQTGAFRDMFLTFSGNSRIEQLRGDLRSKLAQITSSNWGMNTSLESAYREILRVATTNRVPAHEMPKYLLILSDMEFDQATHAGYYPGFGKHHPSMPDPVTAQSMAAGMYAQAGYSLPKIVYWNLHAREGNVPVKFNEQGTALVSGFSPSIMKSILAAKNFTPSSIMMETINSARYQPINIG